MALMRITMTLKQRWQVDGDPDDNISYNKVGDDDGYGDDNK